MGFFVSISVWLVYDCSLLRRPEGVQVVRVEYVLSLFRLLIYSTTDKTRWGVYAMSRILIIRRRDQYDYQKPFFGVLSRRLSPRACLIPHTSIYT